MRYIFLFSFILFFVTSIYSQEHTYKCKDKNGNWTEQACPDFEQRQRQTLQKATEKAAQKNWQPRIGMSADEVNRITNSPECYSTRAYKWCGSHKVNTTRTSRSKLEQWVWRSSNGMPLWYLYFENDILVTIQE
jgi:hypothetical protein